MNNFFKETNTVVHSSSFKKTNTKMVNRSLSDRSFQNKIFNSASCNKILSNKVLKSCYSYKFKGPKIVSYTLDGNLVNQVNIRKRGYWKVNKNIPFKYRGNSNDYIGYDRGHLAFDSAFDYNRRILQNTYDVNINSVPMLAKVNRYTWIKAESHAKDIAYRLGKVLVTDVIVYGRSPKRIGRNRIAVPKGFYKIIRNQNKSYEKCFYYENKITRSYNSDTLWSHVVDCKKAINSARY
jgi:endonuclease G